VFCGRLPFPLTMVIRLKGEEVNRYASHCHAGFLNTADRGAYGSQRQRQPDPAQPLLQQREVRSSRCRRPGGGTGPRRAAELSGQRHPPAERTRPGGQLESMIQL